MKTQHEFGATGSRWATTAHPRATARVLTADPDDPDSLTQLIRWQPDYDSSAAGVISHAYAEEVYLLEGSLTDLTLARTFTAGDHAFRRPGMPHGPYRSTDGCLMLELRSPGGSSDGRSPSTSP